jgi:hypothetical protein
MLVLAGCSGGDEELIVCPRVDAVDGLDRLANTYPGAAEPVATALDIVRIACIEDGDDLIVGSVVSIRLGANRPAGDVRVPYTLVIDTPSGQTGYRADVAIVPAGVDGVYETFEHRFEGLAGREDVAVRLLYALVPDEAERARLERERPRP